MIAIIEGCGSNYNSLIYSLKKIGYTSKVTSNKYEIINASHVILAGVGHASNAMDKLQDLELIKLIPRLKQPVLGICLGMQLLFEFLHEGNLKGLGIFPGEIRKITSDTLAVPHMGWNKILFEREYEKYGKNLDENKYFYFIHSYFSEFNDYTIAKTKYGIDISAIVVKENFTGMQFHPEKSGNNGIEILKNYLKGDKL
jgi:glutamine amidotransferase